MIRIGKDDRGRLAGFAAIAIALAASAPVHGETLFETGFEPPAYAPGNLVGQDGWQPRFGVSPNGATVVAGGGGQLVRIDGAAIQEVGTNFYSGWYLQNIPFDPIAAGLPLVSISADLRLDLGPTAGQVPFLFAFLNPVDENLAGHGTLGIDGFGTVFGQNFASPNQVAVAPINGAGAFHRYRIDLDFLSRTVTFSMDGVSFGSMPFAQSASSRLGGLQLILQSSSPIDSVFFVDNIAVTAVPEPSSLVLLGLGGLAGVGLACRRRLRRPVRLA